MFEISQAREQADRALLVALETPEQSAEQTDDLLAELAELVDTFGAEVVEGCAVKIDAPRPKYLIGSGKAEEVVRRSKEVQANLIVFDDDLTPAQQRNWERISNLPVVDRRGIILDIFGARATTREAELQIELARAEYALPRLKRAWTHLSRQRGGVGVRGGEGEQQIEIDARLLRRRIARLKADLEVVRRRRAEQRKKRRTVPVPNAAIVGYTNAGKSSLLNRLTDAEVLVEDKLFATLDPTTRRILLPNNQVLLLTDTVGFVRKLPHDLVEAFKATLEEAVLADFCLHLVDASSSAALEHIKTTEAVLDEIGALRKRTITVFNKVDQVDDPLVLRQLRQEHPDAVFISVVTGEGLPELGERMSELLDQRLTEVHLCIPQHKYDVVAMLHRTSNVLDESYEPDGIYVTASVPPACADDVAPYRIRPTGS